MSVNTYDFLAIRSTSGVVNNSTTANFSSKIPTTTKPTLDLTSPSGVIGCKGFADLTIIPIGTDTAAQTFKIRVIGWKSITAPDKTLLWVPTLIAEMTCTLGSITGVAGTAVPAANLFANAITLTYGKGVLHQGSLIAQIRVPVEGYEMVELDFDRNASAASANALVSLHDTDRWVS